jgi:phosphohistidine phosphatase SixA
LLALLQQEPAGSRILVVGHQPQMAMVAGTLMKGGAVLIENASLTCFELDQAGPPRLEFHLRAEHLAHMA